MGHDFYNLGRELSRLNTFLIYGHIVSTFGGHEFHIFGRRLHSFCSFFPTCVEIEKKIFESLAFFGVVGPEVGKTMNFTI